MITTPHDDDARRRDAIAASPTRARDIHSPARVGYTAAPVRARVTFRKPSNRRRTHQSPPILTVYYSKVCGFFIFLEL